MGAHDQYENTQLEKSKKINSGQIFLIFIIVYRGAQLRPNHTSSLGVGGQLNMFYVYLIKSVSHPEQKYIGQTDDLKNRLKQQKRFGIYTVIMDSVGVFGAAPFYIYCASID